MDEFNGDPLDDRAGTHAVYEALTSLVPYALHDRMEYMYDGYIDCDIGDGEWCVGFWNDGSDTWDCHLKRLHNTFDVVALTDGNGTHIMSTEKDAVKVAAAILRFMGWPHITDLQLMPS